MKKMMFTTAVLAAAIAFSCNDKGVLEPKNYPDFVVINGDTIKTREDKGIKDKFKGHPEHFKYITTGDTTILYKTFKKNKPSKIANLKNIENADRKGKPFRLAVFGGSLAAGVRDGGLFNEGMETSFGSLLANQMGIEFKSPLFDDSDYNGYGRLEPTNFNPTKGPIPKYKNVSNNLAVDPSKKENNGNVRLKPLRTDFDNYAFPFSSFIRKGETASYINGTIEKTPFEKRLGNINLNAEIKAGKTFDFFVIEIPTYDGYPDFPGNEEEFKHYLSVKEFDNANPPNFGPGATIGAEGYYNNFFKKLQRINGKGVILNTPSISSMPFYIKNYKDDIMKVINTYQLKSIFYGSNNWSFDKVVEIDVKQIFNSIRVNGFSSFDSLVSPVVNVNIKPGINKNKPVIINIVSPLNEDSKWENRIIKNNQKLVFFANRLGYPVVDIYDLYYKVKANNYITPDGVQVNGSLPNGNFFSSDGIHPSAFGQAVITNEIIKVMNSFYKTDIPYINTRDFLK
jgi:hypothetical protein